MQITKSDRAPDPQPTSGSRSLRKSNAPTHAEGKRVEREKGSREGKRVISQTGRKYAAEFKSTMTIVYDDDLPRWNDCALPQSSRYRAAISDHVLRCSSKTMFLALCWSIEEKQQPKRRLVLCQRLKVGCRGCPLLDKPEGQAKASQRLPGSLRLRFRLVRTRQFGVDRALAFCLAVEEKTPILAMGVPGKRDVRPSVMSWGQISFSRLLCLRPPRP